MRNKYFRSSVLLIVFIFKKCRLPYENSDSRKVTQNNRISVTFFLARVILLIYNRLSFISYQRKYFIGTKLLFTSVITLELLTFDEPVYMHWNVCCHDNGRGITKIGRILTQVEYFLFVSFRLNKVC